MGKLISNSLEGAFGTGIFPAISLIIFVLLFIWLIIWALKKDNVFIQEMKNLPIEPQNQTQEESGKNLKS